MPNSKLSRRIHPDRQLIYVSDPSNTTSQVSDPAKPEELREIVRRYDELANVDILVQEIWSQGWSHFWRSENCRYDARPQHQRLIPMIDTGVMPLEVYIDECHRRGITFVVGFRVNDRHGHNADWFEDLSRTHPDWILKGYKPSSPRTADHRSFDIGCALDYTVGAVRDWVLSIIQETASRFDIDGIELNWHRLPACFPLGKAASSHQLMTEYVHRIREMLDEEGEAKGRRLLLGVRVLRDIESNRAMGLDVPTWVTEKLIDYVAPGDLGFTDPNAPLDEFVKLAHQNECAVYPQIQAKLGYHHRHVEQTPSHCRATIQNFYGAGADGYSTQNIFDVEQYETLRSLRDPEKVAAGDRHYVFYPLWGPSDGGQAGYGGDFPYAPEEIKLDRASEGNRQTFRFRIFEKLTGSDKAKLVFRADSLPGDILHVAINGHTVSSNHIERESSTDGETLDTYHLVLRSPPAIYGDNELDITLAKSSEIEGIITINEVEVFVSGIL